jgi:hypothetical protein
VDTGFLLGVRIFDEVKLGFGTNAGNIGKRYKVIDLFALEFEVEASVSEGTWNVDNRLSDFVDLFLGGELLELSES